MDAPHPDPRFDHDVLEGGRTVVRRMGERLGAAAQPGDVIALVGGLGAGKTFLAQAIARGAGVPPDVRVTSPTFTLVQVHAGRLPVYHADFYRLGDPEELREVGLFEMGAEGLVVVEWADRFPEAVPAGALWLALAVVSASVRAVRARSPEARDEAARRLLAAAKRASRLSREGPGA